MLKCDDVHCQKVGVLQIRVTESRRALAHGAPLVLTLLREGMERNLPG